MEVEAAALINDYKVFDKKFTLLKGYPGNEAHHDDKLQKHIADSRVLDCLRTLASLAPRNPDMRVQLSPSKGLFANEIIEVGELFWSPARRASKLRTRRWTRTPPSQCWTQTAKKQYSR